MCSESQTRRDMLKLAGLFTVGGAAPLLSAFNAQAQPDANAPVRIGYLPITDAAPLLIAHHQGFFEQAGIQADKPRLFRSWSQLVEAFISGQVDVVHLLSPMTLWARYGSQVPAKIVAWNHINGSALTVRPEINKISDLGGLRVAIPFWYSIHNVVLQDLLRQNGLTPVTNGGELASDEVELVVMAPSDMLPALANNSIAAYIVAEPFNAAAEIMGVGKVLRFTGDVWRDHACCTVFMHERDLQNRPQWSQSVVTGIVRAQQWIAENRAATADILARESGNRYTPHNQPVLAKVLLDDQSNAGSYLASGAVTHPDWQQHRIGFQPYPYPSYTEALVTKLKATTVQGNSAFLDDLDPSFAAQDLVDDRFVKQAIEALGGPNAFGLTANYTRTEEIAG
ncbi:MAG TPA: ABC transporter substrate-binding protein [Orrella sp.]